MTWRSRNNHKTCKKEKREKEKENEKKIIARISKERGRNKEAQSSSAYEKL